MADATTTPLVTNPPRPRRWGRRLLWLLVVLLVLAFLSPLTLALAPVRDMVADKVGASLGRDVKIGKAFAFWGHGIDLEDVTIASPDGFDGPLATVEKIHADIDVLALVGGGVDASVLVTKPHVTFRRNAKGAGNADGLYEDEDQADEPPSDGERPRIHLVVNDATIESVPTGGAPTGTDGRIEKMDIVVLLAGDGGTSMTLSATAVGAQVGGTDAAITASVGLDASGAGPIEFATPPLDLGRLSALIEGATGVSNLTGQLQANGSATVQPADGDFSVNGHIDVTADGLSALTADDVRLTLAKLVAHLELAGDGARTNGELRVTAERFQVARQTSTGAAYDEPRIQLTAVGSYDAKAESIEVRTGELKAGQTAALDLLKPWRIDLAPMRAVGVAQLRADLAKLARLSPIVPQLERIRGGALNFGIRGNDAADLDLSIGAQVTNLTFAAGDSVVREPKILAQARWRTVDAEVSRLDLYRLTSSAATLTSASAKTPFVVHLRESGPNLDGDVGLNVDLGALSDLLGGLMGLAEGERLAGRVVVSGQAKGDDKSTTANANVNISGLTLPASWAAFDRPGALAFDVTLSSNPGDTRLRANNFTGMGLKGTVTARLSETDGASRLSEAIAKLNVDLAQARPYVGGLLAMERTGRLDGIAECDLRLMTNGDDRTASGFVVLNDVQWQRSALDPVLPRQMVRVDVDVTMRPEGARHVANKLVAGLEGLQVDLSGSTFGAGDDDDLDVRARISGDAARLAPSIAAYLGSDYADLRGKGTIDGSATFGGSTSDNGRDLELDLTLAPGDWTTSGLRLNDTTFAARRTGTSSKLIASMNAKVNDGDVRLSSEAQLGREHELPWSLQFTAKRVDTSGLLTDKGLARYLMFALPAILPQENVPVLSGLLDAELSLASRDISDPALLQELTGDGELHMREGAIKDSTLFRGLSGGKGLGKVGQVLALAVPGLSSTLTAVSQALAFTSIDSEFRIGQRVVQIVKTDLVGPTLSLTMTGTVDFDDRLNLVAKPHFLGSVGKKLSKVVPTATIPLKVTGTTDDPKVTPTLAMTDLAPGALGDVGDIGKKAADKLKDLFGGKK